MALPAAQAEQAALVPPQSGVIKVAFVLSERATVIDFAGPWEVFRDTEAPIPFELYTVAPSRSPLHTSGGHGITVTPDYSFADAPEPDVIVIGAQSGGPGLSEWLLLDGRQATTHHDYTDRLASQFPKIKLVRSTRFVQSAPLIYTAGGLTSGIDLALHIVEGYFGPAVAQSISWKTP
jgi:transcriptional regulator GlxA family with amidase domain